MFEGTLELNSPITEEQWDTIVDVDFDNTDRIWFTTKHGKEVEFVKQKMAKWLPIKRGERGCSAGDFVCSACRKPNRCYSLTDYCSNCGAAMKEERDES